MKVVALTAALACAATAEAGELKATGGRAATPGLWTQLLTWAQNWSDGFAGRFEVLLRPGTLISAPEKEGSSIDPNGTSGTSGT